MTQAQAEATPESAAPAASPTPNALPPELLKDLGEDLRPAPVAPSDDDLDAEDDAGTPTVTTPDAQADAEANASPDAEDSDDADDQQSSPEQEVATWADLLLDNPQTAARIPRARMAEVFTEYNKRLQVAYDAGVQQGSQAATERARREATLSQQKAEVARIEALLEDGDVDGYMDEIEKFPGGRANFKRVSADLEPVAAGSTQDFISRARGIVQQLAPYPQLAAEMQSTWAERGYKADEESLVRLAVDVGRMIERGAKAAPAPEQVKLDQRRKGLAGLKAAPKPDVSEGRNAPLSTAPTKAELQNWTPEQYAAYGEKHGKEALSKLSAIVNG